MERREEKNGLVLVEGGGVGRDKGDGGGGNLGGKRNWRKEGSPPEGNTAAEEVYGLREKINQCPITVGSPFQKKVCSFPPQELHQSHDPFLQT